jgi:leader peptidase (prepilin peptidase) / N-methyltransferase
MDAILLLNAEFPWFFAFFAFAFGAIVGSFLNVCIYRIPAEKSVVTPGSHCACGQPIAWRDNIPIFSWLLLRGRARCCGQPFSFRYPAIEALTGLLFMVCWLRFEPLVALCGMAFAATLVCATFIDLDHMIIPDRFTIGAAVVGVGLSLAVPALHGFEGDLFLADSLRSGVMSVIGLLVGSGTVLWIALLAEVVLRKEAMGFGDVKFLGAIGAFTGWEGALFAIFGGAIIGSLGFAGYLLYKNLRPRRDPADQESEGLIGRATPFGPMLAAGGLLYFLALSGAVDAYFAEAANVLFTPLDW